MHRQRLSATATFFFGLAVMAGCTPGDQGAPAQVQLSINAISNKPYLVSGGNVLLEIQSSSGTADDMKLVVNGIARNLALQPAGSEDGLFSYHALLSGLQSGGNRVDVVLGDVRAELTVVNYPITGPIISGPHQQPYFCLGQLAPDGEGQPRRFAIGNGDYLDSAATDANCSLPSRIDYVYRNGTSGDFQNLEDPSLLPADLAFVTTTEGSRVPYIVRIETGTINRAIYQIALLHDPSGPAPSPLAAPVAWNGRLVYTFGGGCEAGFFQGDVTGGVLRDEILALGYAVASSTLNVNAQGGCNDVISAETAMMVKEHFIETFGLPRYTVGLGGSGGAMQQLLIAGAYPGILDGLLISNTFPDAVSYMTDSQECAGILRQYLNDPSRNIDETTRNAIGGWSMWSTCESSLGDRPKRIAPDDCPAVIPESTRYHPQTNPDGVRCSIYDGMRNIFGESLFPELNSTREFARSPHDNVGVQYGLAALNAGLIDKDLFLDLNEKIGGWDIDVNTVPQRHTGDDQAIRIAYQTGRVSSGGAGLSQVPIIDDRGYLDDIGNFHASVYSFVTRARLERDNGHAGNYILRRHSRELSLESENLALMDEWLANLQGNPSSVDRLERIVAARPAALQNDCFAASGERIVEDPQFDLQNLFDNTSSRCNELFPPHAGLRLVAGGPLTNDILKCQLKPVDYSDYTVSFTDDERARLEQIFAGGVCDWDKPGVHQEVNQTWLSFGPSPVNLYQSP